MNSNIEPKDIVSFFASFITWILIVTGWLVVSERQIQLEVAKNSYARMHRLREDIDEIEKKSVDFHVSGFDKAKLHLLLRSISSLGREVSQLVKAKHLGAGAYSFVTRMRQAVSSNNTEQSTYVCQDFDSEIILEIQAARDALDRIFLESADSVSRQKFTLWELLKAITKKIA